MNGDRDGRGTLNVFLLFLFLLIDFESCKCIANCPSFCLAAPWPNSNRSQRAWEAIDVVSQMNTLRTQSLGQSGGG